MDLIAPLSVEDVQGIINGDPAETYKIIRASTMSEDGLVRHTVRVTNQDLITVFESISRDSSLIARILEDARLTTAEIKSGATSSTRPIQFSQEILELVGALGGNIPDVVSHNLRPAIISFVVYRFGNMNI